MTNRFELHYLDRYYPLSSLVTWHKCLLSAVIAQKKWARRADKEQARINIGEKHKPNWIDRTCIVHNIQGNRSLIPTEDLTNAYYAYDALPQRHK